MFDFDTMIVGHVFDFYGVDNLQFKLGIDRYTFVLEVLEDPSDGYRSYLSCVQISEPTGVFFPTPVAKVMVSEYYVACENGFRLVDIQDGHSWVAFGTNSVDSYYPTFFFKCEPRKDQLSNQETTK